MVDIYLLRICEALHKIRGNLRHTAARKKRTVRFCFFISGSEGNHHNVILMFLSWETVIVGMEIQRIRYLQGSAASYFSVRRFVIGSLGYGPAERRNTRVNILQRDEWFFPPRLKLIYELRMVWFMTTIMREIWRKSGQSCFHNSFCRKFFQEVTNFINAMQLVLTFFMRL